MNRSLLRFLRPANVLYRRESGAGRRVVITAKVLGLMVVVAAYLAWASFTLSGEDWGQRPAWVTAAASCFFSVLAFVLGLQSVRSEITGGTAEALVMTPMSRYRAIYTKLGGSMELLVVASMLLPFYCVTHLSWAESEYAQAFMHGGAFRPWALLDLRQSSWTLWREQSLVTDVATGLAAFTSDLTWCVFFAACGAWAAVSRRSTLAVWTKGVMAAAVLWTALTLVELVMMDPAGAGEVLGICEPRHTWWPRWSARSPMGMGDYDLFRSRRGHPTAPLIAGLWTVSISIRLAVSHLLLSRAARNFERIATD